MRSTPITRLRVLVATGLVLTPVLLLAAGAGSGSGEPTAAARPRPLPARVFAPYFETWSTNRLIRVAERSGVRNFTLAFVQAPKRGSCTPTWNGEPGQTMASGRYQPGLKALRKLGGNVVPSFGGYSADHALTEIADSCTNMRKLVAAYESVVRTYGATRLDMDVETARSKTSPASTAGTRRCAGSRHGPPAPAAGSRSSTRCRLSPPASSRMASTCCETRSGTAPGSTSSTS